MQYQSYGESNLKEVAATSSAAAPPSLNETYSKVSSLSPTQHQVLRELAGSPNALRVDQVAAPLGLHTNTVREVLTTLVEKDLVTRESERSEARGRPRWLYRATVSLDPAVALQAFGSLASAVAIQLAQSSPDPEEAAIQLGRAWGKQILGDPKIPDHSDIDAHTAATRDLDVHSAKLRVFLSQMGFEARPGQSADVMTLHQCPLQDGESAPHVLTCAVHQGMLDQVVETLSRQHLTTSLTPFVEPSVCEVRLCPMRTDLNHKPLPPSEQ